MEVVMVHLKVILTVFLIRLRNTTKIVGHNNHFEACYKQTRDPRNIIQNIDPNETICWKTDKKNRPLHKRDRFKCLI